ncbi:vacuolar fusion protein MON1 [Chytridium lagenaria]|nr:vacuolar fusion protein MON1 [Chytridium lagenaria]
MRAKKLEEDGDVAGRDTVGSLTAPGAASGTGSTDWSRRKRHFFVLSSAGKPIYSRYGDDTELTGYMGILQAIMSFFINEDDTLMSLTAGDHRFVFKVQGPLYLVAVASSGEDEADLEKQLDHLYSQILFILTSTQLNRIFTQRTNYDLRSLLTGTDMFFDEMCRSHLKSMSFNLKSFQCLRVSAKVRQSVSAALVTGTPKNLLYALLIAKDKVVGLARQKRHQLHSLDVLLLINMVNTSTTFKSAESWTPICLPTFHAGAFVHSYVCFLTQELCLVLISPAKDAFFEMSEFKTEVAKSLDENGCVDEIEEAILSDPCKMVEIEVPGIRHFICRPKGVAQLAEPSPLAPYTKKSDFRRLLLQYQYAYRKLESVEGSVKLIFNSGTYETVVGWASNSYEFFAAFSPLVTKEAVSNALTLLQRWVKQNDASLFITSHPLF